MFKTNRCYHLISRVAHCAFFLDDEEKTRLVDFLWRAADFSGVTVIAYAVMTNHFHIVVYVPDPSHPRSSMQAYRLTVRGRKVVT